MTGDVFSGDADLDSASGSSASAKSSGSGSMVDAPSDELSLQSNPLFPGGSSKTNNLSVGKATQPATASGANAGFVHQNITFVPVSYFSSGAVPMMPMPMMPMAVPGNGAGVNGGHPMMPFAPQNISCPPQMYGGTIGATVDASYMNSSSTFDSRNIPPVRDPSAPSSSEDSK